MKFKIGQNLIGQTLAATMLMMAFTLVMFVIAIFAIGKIIYIACGLVCITVEHFWYNTSYARNKRERLRYSKSELWELERRRAVIKNRTKNSK